MPTQPVTRPENEPIPKIQSIISVLWPSFISASGATVLFFVLFNPVDLARLLGFDHLDPFAGYTFGFFSFWLLTSFGCTLTCYFRRPCNKQQKSSDNA